MIRGSFAALFGLAAACGTTSTTVPSGQLSGPSGMAAVSAGDRDLFFIANSGRDDLVAFQLCNKPLLDGGSVDPADTCSGQIDGQYIPGPIRVLAGTVETGNRTRRIAGARLRQTAVDGGTIENGEALAVGADQTLRVVDARVLVNAQERRGDGTTPAALPPVNLGAVGADIAAVNALDARDVEIGSPSVRVFVATLAGGGAGPGLVAMTARLDANGNAQAPAIDGRCDLGTVQPRRIAVAPGRSDFVYVADAAGDGVVKVATAGIAGGPCAIAQRISAGGRSVAALALSPPWYETVTAGQPPVQTDAARDHRSGEILLMVLDPRPGSTPGREVDPGGVLLARTSDGAILPVPPFAYTESGHAPMLPLIPLRASAPGTAIPREAAFLRSLNCASAPCTPLYLGVSPLGSTVGLQSFDLLAAVSSAEGTTMFINVPKRRFVVPDSFTLSQTPQALTPTTAPSVILPAQSDPNAATLIADNSLSVPGVARNSNWSVIFHGPIPGLERKAGTLTRTGPGTVRFVSARADLNLWTSDPVFRLGAGDAAVVETAASGDPACKDVVAAFNATAAGSLAAEMAIIAISGNGTIDLRQPQIGPAFTDACSSIAATLEIRTAGSDPWLIYDGPAGVGGGTPVGRWHTGAAYVARQQRYDYPLDSCALTPTVPCYNPDDPKVTSDVAFTFTITGNDPTSIAAFSIGLTAPTPAFLQDASTSMGLPGGILPYSSPRRRSLLFVSLAGANEILQADPQIMGSAIGGIQTYR